MADSLDLISKTAPKVCRELRRLGKNVNGYLGERIDIAAVLADCVAAAGATGWTIEEFHPTPRLLLAFVRSGAEAAGAGIGATDTGTPRSRLYISTGIHGDEPAGPLAIRQLLQENRWPPSLDLWLVPCLNAAGFVQNRRENPDGLDLNREYLEPEAEEILAHTAWLKRQPEFDLCMCLHEDWESHGFYVYELNPDHRPSLAEAIVAAVAEVCPIDHSETIEGRPARRGIIRPDIDPRSRPKWPESFFLLIYKTRLSYTLEAPSDFPLEARVEALVQGVKAAVAALVARGLK